MGESMRVATQPPDFGRRAVYAVTLARRKPYSDGRAGKEQSMNANTRICQKCGAVAIVYGQRLPAGTPKGTPKTDVWQRFIATRYCPTCAEEQRRENGAWRSRKYRRSRRKERASYAAVFRKNNQRIADAERAIRAQKSYIDALENACAELRDEVFNLRAERQAAYSQGKADARRGLVGGALRRLAGQ